MRTEPLLGATAVGAIIIIVFNVISTIIALNSPQMQGLGTGLSCLVSLVVGILVGLIYSGLHGREASLSVGTGVKGGAAAGALVFFINGILTIGIGLLLAPQLSEAVAILGAERGTLIEAEFLNSFLFLGYLTVVCGGIVLGALFGALGGAIGGAVFGQEGGVSTSG